jgi:histone deacetylase 4/5
MALEGGYNLRSIANSVFACAKVLLGDTFTFTSPEMQPFESTWRVIQAVMVNMYYYCFIPYFS